jgi:prepilin peptidase CpaA
VAVLIFAMGAAAFCAGLFGGGDVKLLAATALFVGPADITGFLMLVALAGGVLSMTMLVLRWMPVTEPAEPANPRFATVP